MKNSTLARLGKCMLIGSIVFSVILAIVSLIPRWRDLLTWLFYELFGKCYDEIMTAPALLLPLASALIFLLIGMLICLILKPSVDKKEDAEKQKSSSSFYTFYLFSFTLSALFIFLLSTAVSNPFAECAYNHRFLIGFTVVIYCGCTIISLLQSSLLLSAVIIRKDKMNKMASMLLFAVAFGCLLSTVFAGIWVTEKSDECSVCSTYEYGEEDWAEEVEPYDDEEDVEYIDRFESEDDLLCHFLWDESDHCADSVNLALRYINQNKDFTHVSDLIVRGNEVYSKEYIPSYGDWNWKNIYEYRGYRNYYQIVNFLKEGNEHLLSAFESYGYLFFKTFSQTKYMNSGASHLIATLDRVYKDIYLNENDGDEKIAAIYQCMTSENHGMIEEYFDSLLPYISDDVLNTFRDSSGDIEKRMVVWTYSFWARRDHEGTTSGTRYILQEIANYYE